jgi:hypothetical protein
MNLCFASTIILTVFFCRVSAFLLSDELPLQVTLFHFRVKITKVNCFERVVIVAGVTQSCLCNVLHVT